MIGFSMTGFIWYILGIISGAICWHLIQHCGDAEANSQEKTK